MRKFVLLSLFCRNMAWTVCHTTIYCRRTRSYVLFSAWSHDIAHYTVWYVFPTAKTWECGLRTLCLSDQDNNIKLPSAVNLQRATRSGSHFTCSFVQKNWRLTVCRIYCERRERACSRELFSTVIYGTSDDTISKELVIF